MLNRGRLLGTGSTNKMEYFSCLGKTVLKLKPQNRTIHSLAFRYNYFTTKKRRKQLRCQITDHISAEQRGFRLDKRYQRWLLLEQLWFFHQENFNYGATKWYCLLLRNYYLRSPIFILKLIVSSSLHRHFNWWSFTPNYFDFVVDSRESLNSPMRRVFCSLNWAEICWLPSSILCW